MFLAGISLGNWLGGRLADRAASERAVRRLLLAGVATMLVSLGVVWLLGDGSALRGVPFYPRVLLLTLATCLPPALVLSLITPVAIKLQLPDVAHTGRVAGLVYAVGTFGSLVGTFLTGFVLLAHLTTYAIVLAAAGALLLSALIVRRPRAAWGLAIATEPLSRKRLEQPVLTLRTACGVVFAASFCSMALEIAASRLLAPHLGVSLYSWTCIIGVVLAGVMFGNWAGGRIADQSPKVETLATCLFLAGLFALLTIIVTVILSRTWDPSGGPVTRALATAINFINERGVIGRIVAWTGLLFLAPMYLLGTISPQVTRLAVSDLDHAGRVAGRIYAWSCAGAIAGTFAAGWGGIPLLGGVMALILAVAMTLVVLSWVVGGLWRKPAELFLGVIVVGCAIFGLGIRGRLVSQYDLETNYYAIGVTDERVYVHGRGSETRVRKDSQDRITRKLALDALTHSYVTGWLTTDADGKEIEFRADVNELGYPHEQVQADFVRLAADRSAGAPHVLVIGGGGYTLPRWADATFPAATVDVVEIDPGVTEVAHRKLGLPRVSKINITHMDGRQFVQEHAAAGSYHLVVQDAVNDLSVPYHIMTREYNAAVKRLLTPGGIYLLTVIDEFEDGLLLRAAVRTMRETFEHVEVLAAEPAWERNTRAVFVIYGADQPFDPAALEAASAHQKAAKPATVAMPTDELQAYLDRRPAPVLTDSFAPVDNLISVVFRKRAEGDRED
jgi:spermidine synthase